jgi:hypothetical protein
MASGDATTGNLVRSKEFHVAAPTIDDQAHRDGWVPLPVPPVGLGRSWDAVSAEVLETDLGYGDRLPEARGRLAVDIAAIIGLFPDG